MNKQPVFLTDRDRLVILEAIAGMPNAAVPDSLKPFEVLEPNTSEGASEKHLPIIETDRQGRKHLPSHERGTQHRLGLFTDEGRGHHAGALRSRL